MLSFREGSPTLVGDDETVSTAPTLADGNVTKSVSRNSASQQVPYNPAPSPDTDSLLLADHDLSVAGSSVPQQRRVMEDLARRSPKEPSHSSLELDEENWGKRLVKLRLADLQAPLEIPNRGQKYKRIRKEVLDMQSRMKAQYGAAEGGLLPFSVRVAGCDEDAVNVRATLEGPPQSPYKGGIFHLSWQYSSQYPFVPPTVRFLTRIYHPNIDHEGNICMDRLEHEWTPCLTLNILLHSILSIMSSPTFEDPLVLEIAATYIQNRDLYEENARLYTQRYATDKQSYPAWEVFPLPDA